MSAETQKTSTIYRFHDEVAIHFDDTQTLYLSRDHAEWLGALLTKYVVDIDTNKFVDSILGMQSIGETRPPFWKPANYWENHPDHSAEGWQHEVECSWLRQSYVDWVNSKIQEAHDEES